MSTPERGSQEWFDQVVEEVVDPQIEIVDPHHHLWPPGAGMKYGLPELHADVISGHRVAQTVFVECGASYRTDGPDELKPVGETEFVARVAASDPSALITAIVAHADLRLDNLDEVLDAHVEAGSGLFRGIRDALARADGTTRLAIPGGAPRDLFADTAFRRGLTRLGERGLTYDCWHYHYQNQEFLELARSAPGTTMVLDHFGTPLGVGDYATQREEIFEVWKRDITAIAECPNVVAKIGGLAMPDNGFGWHRDERPPTSDEFVAAQRRYYLHTIEAFGPERCMFESNFPVDRYSLSYQVLWNGLKKIVSDFTVEERASMFAGTARRTYQLEVKSDVRSS